MYTNNNTSAGANTDIYHNQLSNTLCQMIECGQQISAIDYNRAIIGQDTLNSGLDACFEHYDIIKTCDKPPKHVFGLKSALKQAFLS